MEKFNFKIFSEIKEFIRKEFGIVIQDSKYPIFKSKINKLMKRFGYENPLTYIEDLKKGQSKLLDELISFVTIKKTEFFRDVGQLEYIRENREKICSYNPGIDERSEILAWSSACSTGQEAYTIAMVLDETFPDYNIQVLASDLDEKALKIARKGHYPKLIEEEVPKQYLEKYFEKVEDGYLVKDYLREKICFMRLNLKKEFQIGYFDMIFCKNTIIYFDEIFREELIDKFFQVCREGGLFFIGYAETLSYLDHRFKLLEKSVYIKR